MRPDPDRLARLERALELVLDYLDRDDRPPEREFLDAHPDIRDLLAPMLRAPQESEDGDGGEGEER